MQVALDLSSLTNFTIDMNNGLPPLELSSKDRNIFYATLNSLIHKDTRSKTFDERKDLLFEELNKEQTNTHFSGTSAGIVVTRNLWNIADVTVRAQRFQMVSTLSRLVNTLSIDQWKGSWKVSIK